MQIMNINVVRYTEVILNIHYLKLIGWIQNQLYEVTQHITDICVYEKYIFVFYVKKPRYILVLHVLSKICMKLYLNDLHIH